MTALTRGTSLLGVLLAVATLAAGEPNQKSSKSDVDKTEQVKPDSTKPGADKPDGVKPVKQDETKPEQKPEQSKPEGTKPDATKPEQRKPDSTKPDTKPETTKPDGEKPQTVKPGDTKPEATKPGGDKPDEVKPDKQDQTKPATKQEQTKPEADKPAGTKDDDTKQNQEDAAARAATALEFAKANHPELAALLEQLHSSNPMAFKNAVDDLIRAHERLARVQERSPDRYESELALWRLDSRIRLLAAQSAMSNTDEVRAELKGLLSERRALKLTRMKEDRERQQARLQKLDESIAEMEAAGDQSVDNELEQLLGQARKRVREVKPQRTSVRERKPGRTEEQKDKQEQTEVRKDKQG
jgi:hypothetical protein